MAGIASFSRNYLLTDSHLLQAIEDWYKQVLSLFI